MGLLVGIRIGIEGERGRKDWKRGKGGFEGGFEWGFCL